MTDNKTIYQVDAFTDEPFKGNPAGVMIVDEKVILLIIKTIYLQLVGRPTLKTHNQL
jgi:hypothetical protein